MEEEIEHKPGGSVGMDKALKILSTSYTSCFTRHGEDFQEVEYTDTNVDLGLVRYNHLERYLNFLDTDETIKLFLEFDYCYVHADNYLLAVVFQYFLRLNLHPDNYKKEIFFPALSLALDICEEANENAQHAVYVWSQVIGTSHIVQARMNYNILKLDIFLTLNCKTSVCSEWCEALFEIFPHSPAFQRARESGHSGAFLRQVQIIDGQPYSVRFNGTCSRCIGENLHDFVHPSLPLTPNPSPPPEETAE